MVLSFYETLGCDLWMTSHRAHKRQPNRATKSHVDGICRTMHREHNSRAHRNLISPTDPPTTDPPTRRPADRRPPTADRIAGSRCAGAGSHRAATNTPPPARTLTRRCTPPRTLRWCCLPRRRRSCGARSGQPGLPNRRAPCAQS
eukprot:7384837-Prymnesium_polylepis.1